MNEFTFAARVASLKSRFRKVVLHFSLFDELDPLVKFNPRFFLLSQQYNSDVYLPFRLSHAWSMPLGVFLFVAKPDSTRLRTLFVAAGNPQVQKLRAVLSRLQAQSSVDKPSLSAYFWRMNVLR